MYIYIPCVFILNRQLLCDDSVWIFCLEQDVKFIFANRSTEADHESSKLLRCRTHRMVRGRCWQLLQLLVKKENSMELRGCAESTNFSSPPKKHTPPLIKSYRPIGRSTPGLRATYRRLDSVNAHRERPFIITRTPYRTGAPEGRGG